MGSWIGYDSIPGALADTGSDYKSWDADEFVDLPRPTNSPTPSDGTTSSKSLDDFLNSFHVMSFETRRKDPREMRFEEIVRSTARTGVIIYDDHVSVVSNPNASASDEERDDDECVANDGDHEDNDSDDRAEVCNDDLRRNLKDSDNDSDKGKDSDATTSDSSSTDSSKSPVYDFYN